VIRSIDRDHRAVLRPPTDAAQMADIANDIDHLRRALLQSLI
jgi:hypothetical protein